MGILQHDAYGSASNLTAYSENDGVQSLTLDTTASEAVNENQAWQQQQLQQSQIPRYYEQSMIPQNDNSINGFTQPVMSEGKYFGGFSVLQKKKTD